MSPAAYHSVRLLPCAACAYVTPCVRCAPTTLCGLSVCHHMRPLSICPPHVWLVRMSPRVPPFLGACHPVCLARMSLHVLAVRQPPRLACACVTTRAPLERLSPCVACARATSCAPVWCACHTVWPARMSPHVSSCRPATLHVLRACHDMCPFVRMSPCVACAHVMACVPSCVYHPAWLVHMSPAASHFCASAALRGMCVCHPMCLPCASRPVWPVRVSPRVPTERMPPTPNVWLVRMSPRVPPFLGACHPVCLAHVSLHVFAVRQPSRLACACVTTRAPLERMSPCVACAHVTSCAPVWCTCHTVWPARMSPHVTSRVPCDGTTRTSGARA